MNIEEVREYCLAKKGVSESFPFDDTSLVIKVLDKMFIIISLDDDKTVNLKCIPDEIIQRREKFKSVVPGYHMNKNHWNTVFIEGDVPESLLKNWIDESYNLVVSGMTKKKQKLLLSL